MSRRKPLTEEEISEIKKLRDTGLSFKKISEKTGIKESTVYRYGSGTTKTNPIVSRSKAIKLYKQGRGVAEIALAINRSQSTVRNYLVGIDREEKGVFVKTSPIKEGTEKFVLGGVKKTIVYAKKGSCIEELKKKYGII